jgi:hypothetical protein
MKVEAIMEGRAQEAVEGTEETQQLGAWEIYLKSFKL